jgi:hypothetical protein
VITRYSYNSSTLRMEGARDGEWVKWKDVRQMVVPAMRKPAVSTTEPVTACVEKERDHGAA